MKATTSRSVRGRPHPRVSLLPEQEIHGSLRTAQEIWWTGWIKED